MIQVLYMLVTVFVHRPQPQKHTDKISNKQAKRKVFQGVFLFKSSANKI